MGENEQGNRDRLLASARTILARGDSKFSISALCAEAGVSREAFRENFAGKAGLMAAVLEPQPAQEVIAAPDAWLERRLRVFERALTSLEAKADATSREHARTIAALEEKLASLDLKAAPMSMEGLVPQCLKDDMPFVAETVKVEAPLLPPLECEQPAALSREEMADVLQSARGKTRAAPDAPVSLAAMRLRWLIIGVLSLTSLFLCAGLTMGDTARATAADISGSGTTARRAAPAGLARTVALADAGDARAQTALAVAYLRGAGVAEDASAAARWSASAAQSGQPVAQYLLAALYGQGAGVAADPVRAFELLGEAAARGNLKAMHNLAIAHAHGTGTPKDEAKAAEWFARAAARGYVDSAFDLGVLHERGMGVKQDLVTALKWYEIAALAGDAQARGRVQILKSQVSPAQGEAVLSAARAFVPLPAVETANRLPVY